MATRKFVPAAEVRSWGRENIALVPESARAGLGETSRGRIHPELVKAFRKANPRKDYAAKVAEEATVTVPVTFLNKAGRKATRQQTITMSEARALIGAEGKRGRLSLAELSLALSAAEADAVAKQFS